MKLSEMARNYELTPNNNIYDKKTAWSSMVLWTYVDLSLNFDTFPYHLNNLELHCSYFSNEAINNNSIRLL